MSGHQRAADLDCDRSVPADTDLPGLLRRLAALVADARAMQYSTILEIPLNNRDRVIRAAIGWRDRSMRQMAITHSRMRAMRPKQRGLAGACPARLECGFRLTRSQFGG